MLSSIRIKQFFAVVPTYLRPSLCLLVGPIYRECTHSHGSTVAIHRISSLVTSLSTLRENHFSGVTSLWCCIDAAPNT